jgi:hypothetical protein
MGGERAGKEGRKGREEKGKREKRKKRGKILIPGFRPPNNVYDNIL